MELKLYVDTFNRKLVKSATSDFPVTLPALFREDTVRMVITLLEPTGNFTAPMQVVDVSDIDIAAGIGVADSDPEVLQETWTKDTTANTFTADVVFNTTELNNAFSNASGDTISRHFEIEVERSTKFHTVLQQAVTLHKDIITNPTVPPADVTSGSAFANSFAATAADSTTVEWTKTGDYNYAHLKGTTGLSSLTAGKILKVNSGGTGFELADEASGGASAINDLSDVDTSTTAPTDGQVLKYSTTTGKWAPADDNTGGGGGGGATTLDGLNDVSAPTPATGDHLKFDGTNWVPDSNPPAHSHATDDLTDVDTSTTAPTDGQVLKYSAAQSKFIPADDNAGTGGSSGPAALTHQDHASKSGVVSLDMDAAELYSIEDVDGDITLTLANIAAGKRVAVRLTGDGTAGGHGMATPMGWQWISDKPIRILDGELMVISLTAFGPDDGYIVAAAAPVAFGEQQTIAQAGTVTI